MKSNNGKESIIVWAAELRDFVAFTLFFDVTVVIPLKSSSFGNKEAPNVGFNISGGGGFITGVSKKNHQN